MPYIVTAQDSACPKSKPFGIHNQQTGELVACHASRASADAQMRALYANVPDASAGMDAQIRRAAGR